MKFITAFLIVVAISQVNATSVDNDGNSTTTAPPVPARPFRIVTGDSDAATSEPTDTPQTFGPVVAAATTNSATSSSGSARDRSTATTPTPELFRASVVAATTNSTTTSPVETPVSTSTGSTTSNSGIRVATQVAPALSTANVNSAATASGFSLSTAATLSTGTLDKATSTGAADTSSSATSSKVEALPSSPTNNVTGGSVLAETSSSSELGDTDINATISIADSEDEAGSLNDFESATVLTSASGSAAGSSTRETEGSTSNAGGHDESEASGSEVSSGIGAMAGGVSMLSIVMVILAL
ncbi:hypothetical protein PHYSODRAFT_334399 [Phytophthora sojae]|uniref:Uncharacterized protein n=1 Tax=Phytophthora sojae (strain P6497) TaxID=1094619 RepID=G4ZKN4_PHYSP|nr:hypothetical protein PHYSODRAFT_334399 [Phytophthora sojae]EGZ16215.1 hypothetical protein PHYSODRAFT_334399 [Phytophthora sojae]|eukprot:XP_009529964.1 hypothetical protein PHYSODRAFT_334399 [Phytophthora sojae]